MFALGALEQIKLAVAACFLVFFSLGCLRWCFRTFVARASLELDLLASASLVMRYKLTLYASPVFFFFCNDF